MSNLVLKNLVKNYGQLEVVHSINLHIQSGEFIVLVGPSGCGKSTVLRMIAGLEEVTSGDIVIDDKIVTRVPAAKREIAMVFQSYALYPHMTVKENLIFGLKNTKASKEHIATQLSSAADILQLSNYLDRLPSNLSGGQRQRVAIGRSIVRNPRIFLFDEPLSNLDAELRVQMRHELIKLHTKLGSTMVYVTHDQVEAMTMADRIVVFNEGNIEQVGSPLELYNEPDNTFVASFIGSPKINLLNGKVLKLEENEVVLSLDNGSETAVSARFPTLHIGDNVVVGLRPEQLSTTIGKGDATFDIGLDKDDIESLGDATYIYAKFGDLDFRVKLSGQHSFKDGHSLTVGIPSEKVRLFDANGNAIHTESSLAGAGDALSSSAGA